MTHANFPAPHCALFVSRFSPTWSGIIILNQVPGLKLRIFANCTMLYVFHDSVDLLIYKPMHRPCSEYGCHIWCTAPIRYLEILDEIQRQICLIIGPDLWSQFLSHSDHRDLASMCLSNKHVHCNYSNELSFSIILLHKFWRLLHCQIESTDKLFHSKKLIIPCTKDVIKDDVLEKMEIKTWLILRLRKSHLIFLWHIIRKKCLENLISIRPPNQEWQGETAKNLFTELV